MSEIRIASFDGGGVRGIIQSVASVYIEEMIGAPILRNFHLSAGTSAGAINAAAFTKPAGWDKPLYPAREVYSHFSEKSVSAIFKPKSSISNNSTIRNFRIPFDADRKHAVFEAVYNRPYFQKHKEDLWLSDIEDYLLLVTTRAGKHKSLIMSTEAAKNKPTQDFKLSDAVDGSTAASGFFKLPKIYNRAGDGFILADGGFAAKNPLGIAFEEATRVWGLKHKFIAVSFGTGYQQIPYNEDKLRNMSLVEVGLNDHYLFMDTQSDLVLKQATWKENNVDLIRFDIDFDSLPKDERPNYDMTDASPENIQKLENAARTMMGREENKRKLQRLYDIFKDTKIPREEIVPHHMDQLRKPDIFDKARELFTGKRIKDLTFSLDR
ncbi:MAG: patatin-like phospholipase family protein [Pseudomonadota bacterium]